MHPNTSQQVQLRWPSPIEVDRFPRTLLGCHCVQCWTSCPGRRPFLPSAHLARQPTQAKTSLTQHPTIDTSDICACTDILFCHGNIIAAGCHAASAPLHLRSTQPLRCAPSAQSARQEPVHLPTPKTGILQQQVSAEFLSRGVAGGRLVAELQAQRRQVSALSLLV